jgi:hypothetical protein
MGVVCTQEWATFHPRNLAIMEVEKQKLTGRFLEGPSLRGENRHGQAPRGPALTVALNGVLISPARACKTE